MEVNEVVESIKKNNHSTVSYDIEIVLVTQLKNIQAGPFTEVFNDRWTSWTCPNCLKVPKIAHIVKEAKINDPSDYRAILLLLVEFSFQTSSIICTQIRRKPKHSVKFQIKK